MKKSKALFCFSFLALASLLFGLVFGLKTTKVAKAESNVAIDANDYTDDSWKGTSTIKGVLHSAWTATSAPLTLEEVGSEKAFKFTFNKGGQYANDCAVKFANSFNKDDINKIIIRMFLHVTPSGTYQYSTTPDTNGRIMNGIMLFGSDKNGYGANGFDSDGYFIPQTIAQDAWVNVELTGDDILPFLNAQDKFDGLQFAARHDGGPGTTVYETGNYVAVSKVTVLSGDDCTVTFGGDYGIESQYVAKNGFATKPVDPVMEGKRFKGWYDGNNIWLFDKYPVTGDLSLTPKFENDNYTITLLDAAEYDNNHAGCYGTPTILAVGAEPFTVSKMEEVYLWNNTVATDHENGFHQGLLTEPTFRMGYNNSGNPTCGNYSLVFNRDYTLEETDRVLIRYNISSANKYANLTSGYYWNAVWFYSSDSKGAKQVGSVHTSPGLLVPEATQGQYVDLILSYDEAQILFNSKGSFDGLQFAARLSGNNAVCISKVQILKQRNTATVTFAGDLGIDAQEVDINGYATRPADPVVEGKRFRGWYAGNNIWLFDKYPVTNDLVLTAKFEENENTITLLDAAEYDNAHAGCYGTPTILAVGAEPFTVSAKSDVYLWNNTVTTDHENGFHQGLLTEPTFRMGYNNSGNSTCGNYSLVFNRDYTLEATDKVLIRYNISSANQYANLTSGYYWNAVWFYSSDSKGAKQVGSVHTSPGLLVPEATQGQYVDLVLTYDEAQILFNSKGSFDGLQFAARLSGNNAVCISKVQILKQPPKTTATVTFAGDLGIDAQEVSINDYATKPADPEQAGKTFDGWFFGDIRWYFDSYKVVDDMVLTPKFNDEGVYVLLNAAEYNNTYNACYGTPTILAVGAEPFTVSAKSEVYLWNNTVTTDHEHGFHQGLINEPTFRMGFNNSGNPTCGNYSLLFNRSFEVGQYDKVIIRYRLDTPTAYANMVSDYYWNACWLYSSDSKGAKQVNGVHTSPGLLIPEGTKSAYVDLELTYEEAKILFNSEGKFDGLQFATRLSGNNAVFVSKVTVIKNAYKEVTLKYPNGDQKVLVSGVLEEPESPSEQFHHFDGWFNGEVEWNFENEVTENITLTPKFSHVFNKNVESEEFLKEAGSCTTKAVYYVSCGCGECGTETFESSVEPHHDYTLAVENSSVAATCTEAGKEADLKCAHCDSVQTGAVVEPLGHNLIDDAAVSATCTEAGKEAGKHCSRCEYTEGGAVVEALGHDLIDDAAVSATCTEAGKEAGKHCSRCEYTEGGAVVNALGHTEVVLEAKDATYDEEGLTEGKKCSVCGTILVAQQTIPKLEKEAKGCNSVIGACAISLVFGLTGLVIFKKRRDI